MQVNFVCILSFINIDIVTITQLNTLYMSINSCLHKLCPPILSHVYNALAHISFTLSPYYYNTLSCFLFINLFHLFIISFIHFSYPKGVSRSAAVVIGYVMEHFDNKSNGSTGLSFDASLELVKSSRW